MVGQAVKTITGKLLLVLDDEWRGADELAEMVDWSSSYVRMTLRELQAAGLAEVKKIRNRMLWRRCSK